LPDSTIHFLRVLPYFHFLCFFFSCILLIILDMGFLVFRLCCFAIILGFLFLFGSSYKLENFHSTGIWFSLKFTARLNPFVWKWKGVFLYWSNQKNYPRRLDFQVLISSKNSPEKRKRKPQLDMKKNILEKPLADELE